MEDRDDWTCGGEHNLNFSIFVISESFGIPYWRTHTVALRWNIDLKTHLFSQSDSFDSTESESESLIDSEYITADEDESKQMVSRSSPQGNDLSPENDELEEQLKNIRSIINKFDKK